MMMSTGMKKNATTSTTAGAMNIKAPLDLRSVSAHDSRSTTVGAGAAAVSVLAAMSAPHTISARHSQL
jgi:hypothetical protein